ncbi:hypothetical protein ACGFY8_05425 [Streptomyces sp. NPDC048232]|uniref:hypothetical protein n=1 Tax=Streptomyces sp. NPDC048232 TaxID=3365520 RepID=UPI0037103A17
MTRRPILSAALVLTAVVTLTLSGCGGGDTSSDRGGEPLGVSVGDGPSASPSPSDSMAEGRPSIDFPSDAKNVFEGEKTGDSAKDAVLADNALSIDAVDEAIFKGSADTKALGFYNVDKALSSSIAYVQGYIDDNDTWIGVTRYFDRKVTLKGTDKAYVAYCSDESKSYIKNKKSGKVDKSVASADSFVLYNTALTKNAAGVWQTTDISSKRGDAACRP